MWLWLRIFTSFLEDSTRFLDAAACADPQKELPAPLAPPPYRKKQSSRVKAAVSLAAVKKSTRVRCPGVVCALYKQLFPPKTPF